MGEEGQDPLSLSCFPSYDKHKGENHSTPLSSLFSGKQSCKGDERWKLVLSFNVVGTVGHGGECGKRMQHVCQVKGRPLFSFG